MKAVFFSEKNSNRFKKQPRNKDFQLPDYATKSRGIFSHKSCFIKQRNTTAIFVA